MNYYDMPKSSLSVSIPPLQERTTVRKLLSSRCQKYSDKTFLISPESGRRYTYAEFYRKVNKVSNFLWQQGVRKEDKIALLMPNSAAFLWSFFGAIQLGAIACPLNIHLKKEEIAYILDNSESSVLFISEEYYTASTKLAAAKNNIRLILAWDPPAGEATLAPPTVKTVDLNAALKNISSSLLAEIEKSPLEPDDVAEIIYTSGTTGRPKGAMLTHHNMIIDAHWIAHWNRLKENDRALCVMPLFHVNGQIVTVMTPLYCGGSIIMPQRFSVTQFFPQAAKYGAAYVGTVATMLSMLLNRIRKEDIPPELKLRIVFCGSAPVPAEVQIEFEKTFRIPVIEGYGMSETTCRSTFNPLPPPEALQLGKNDGYRKIGSVGLPLGNEMMVVDENGRPLKPHEIGEIVIRGENVMKGYYKNPQATAEAFRDGWFHSGDLGYYDEDGYFFIVDRKNDLIIRGGENIYPREIEEVLYKHPAVKDAACVGIPDELYGEEVAAFVVLKDHEKAGEEEIISFCHRFLADFKCPKQVKIVREIPKSSSGKLLRRKLRGNNK
ncbi:MAG: long-chain-fatty-acid--CoA ligase [Firmicutes bacterium]|mgnify:CR=1 FL=1|nr:long-chain-fatty-acid--CoA ligase [Bacillota bacterium]